MEGFKAAKVVGIYPRVNAGGRRGVGGGPEWSERKRVTWSDGCLRKMTLAAVCI